MSVWDKLFPTREMVSDVQATVWQIKLKIDKMGANMADVSQVLNDVAAGIRDNLGPRISELLAENASLRTRNAELEGEDVAESDSAAGVKTAFDGVVGLFDQTEEAPTPDPLPEVPAADSGSGEPQA